VWISYLRHSPNWRVVKYFHSSSPNATGQLNLERVSEKGKQPSPDWRVGPYFYSPIRNYTRIWRVGEWLSAPLIFMYRHACPLINFVALQVFSYKIVSSCVQWDKTVSDRKLPVVVMHTHSYLEYVSIC
jgi:hypothetical protein